MKIGIIREGKTPPDKRVALNPKQCEQLLANYPQLEIAVQPSTIRCYSDADYTDLGIDLADHARHIQSAMCPRKSSH